MLGEEKVPAVEGAVEAAGCLCWLGHWGRGLFAVQGAKGKSGWEPLVEEAILRGAV